MSYNPSRNEDSLSELISSQTDAKMVLERLLANKNDINTFIVWFDKACRIDKRSTAIFLRKHMNEFNADIQRYLTNYVKEKRPMEVFY